MEEPFEPIIVCYCCTWCSYAAADLAGSMRLQYPTNVRIVKVPCTGRVDTIFLLRALEKGADGVFVSGCLLGDCHYLSGNFRAKKRVTYVKELLGKIGGESEQVDNALNEFIHVRDFDPMGPAIENAVSDPDGDERLPHG